MLFVENSMGKTMDSSIYYLLQSIVNELIRSSISSWINVKVRFIACAFACNQIRLYLVF